MKLTTQDRKKNIRHYLKQTFNKISDILNQKSNHEEDERFFLGIGASTEISIEEIRSYELKLSQKKLQN